MNTTFLAPTQPLARTGRVLAVSAALLGGLLLSSCNGGSQSTTSSQTAATGQRTVARRGGYAFSRVDTPYAEVAAEARRTGRPMLIYFWTSW